MGGHGMSPRQGKQQTVFQLSTSGAQAGGAAESGSPQRQETQTQLVISY